MADNPLVSIISPCFNGEKYLSKFLESVLLQTYDNIELILIDDGSTDNTKNIFMSYQPKLEEKGYSVIYIYQENAGQAAAINQGLRIFNGEYLIWVDSDDILLKRNVEVKYDYLKEHAECGFVLGQGNFVTPEGMKKGELKRLHTREDNLFEDLIYGRNVIYGPGAIMARREAILKSIPSRQIYEGREGQNWQLMLPLAHMFQCGYLDEIVFLCVEHSDSHSRQKRTLEDSIKRMCGLEDILTHTIDSLVDMDQMEKEDWKRKIRLKYLHRRLRLYYGDNADWLKWWKNGEIRDVKDMLKGENDYSYRDTFVYYGFQKNVRKLKSTIKKISAYR